MNTIHRTAHVFALVLTAVAACVLLTAPAAQAQQEVADKLIARSDAVIAQLGDLRQQGKLDNESALGVIRQEMSPLLDFGKLTKRAMGKYWRRTDEAMRAQVTEAFRELLERTYAKVLAQYSGQQVELLEVQPLPEDNLAVRLQISDGSKTAEVEYVFSPAAAGESLVSDIKVEGISLVANYRRQFAAVLGKADAAELVKKLQQLAAAKF